MKHKFNGSNRHKAAILHMIGQSQSVFLEYATVSDIATWMNVSKTTARKYLLIMSNDGEIEMVKKPYKNMGIIQIGLTDVTWREFLNGTFKDEYTVYAQRVMGIVLTDSSDFTEGDEAEEQIERDAHTATISRNFYESLGEM